MKFWEAMKALEEGKKIKQCFSREDGSGFVTIPFHRNDIRSYFALHPNVFESDWIVVEDPPKKRKRR